MKRLKWVGVLCAAAGFLPQAYACYTVYNPTNQIVYSGVTPPIDMSYQIHEKLPAEFPSGHLVFNTEGDCTSADARKVAPLLTNVSGAAAAASSTPATYRTVRQAPPMSKP